MPSATPSELQVRRASSSDAAEVARVFLASRRSDPERLPPPAHTDEEVAAWFADRVDRDEVWVAADGQRVVGFARIVDSWLDDLYVEPGATGAGVGSLLLDTVKAVRPDGFSLWVFESNDRARSFYVARGLVELEHTDGQTNEERQPDVRMVWPGRDPVAFLRARIDEVDQDLAGVLERRAALSRVIQAHKPVGGHEGRDPEREREIAQRMAGQAPSLPLEALVKVVDAVIAAGLDSRGRGSGGSVGSA